MPGVLGLSETDASNQLVNAGFRVAQPSKRAESPLEQKDKVVSTEPSGGSQLPTGSTVTLVIGSGPKSAVVPNILNMSINDASKALKDKGLTLGRQDTADTDDPTKIGKIVSSNPAPGTEVAGSSAVDVSVGVAATEVEIPDVKGEDAARRRSRCGPRAQGQRAVRLDEPGTTAP